MKYSDMLGKLTLTRRCNSLQELRQPLRAENDPGFQVNQNLGPFILQLQRNKFCQKSKWTWKQIVSQSSHQIRAQTCLYCSFKFSSVQLLGQVQLFVTPWTPACQASLSITDSQSLLKFLSSDVIQPSHPMSSPFFSCLQSFPASGSFPVNQFFTSGGQSIGVSASASVLPMNIQDWFPLEWTERPQYF